MNCDTAFELMTDAGGCQSAALAQHLGGCPRCRQMQETLAPALGFLADSAWSSSAHEPFGDRDEASGNASRHPFLTLEALKVARDAASALSARTETRPDRRNAVFGRALRFAAVFAAGVVLGLILLENRDRPAPQGKECARHAAARDGITRSDAEVQRLALSCAACHDAATKPIDNRATLLNLNRSRQLDWLEELFREESLVAVDWHIAAVRAFNQA
jgi:hypothetical protein